MTASLHPRFDYRRKCYRTLSLLCEDEPLSDSQLKTYQTRLQEYRTFLEAVGRLALCSNVCITEEAVSIGEHGLLNGESLNALQHAGAISVYNTLQQNNWEFPVSEEGEVAVIRTHNPVPDDFLDSEKPIRPDWPAIHISECFIEGERAKLHGSVQPLRTFLPPTVVFRNAVDVDDDLLEPELNSSNSPAGDGTVELVPSSKGINVKKVKKDGKGVEFIPLEDYYFGRQEGNGDYYEDKGNFRFKCAVCQRIFYSNLKAMSHILGHIDEGSQSELTDAARSLSTPGDQQFPSIAELRTHIDQDPMTTAVDTDVESNNPFVAQTASQLLMQQQKRIGDLPGSISDVATDTLGQTPNAAQFSCRICGKEAASELSLAHHLQSTHRQREMPYVCRLCLFRSSMFEDILDHFKKSHENSNHLLCTFCLSIFSPSDARASVGGIGTGNGQTQVYLQHLRKHQIRHQLRRCPSCKLNFTNKSDYQVHRRLDHKASTQNISHNQSYDSDAGDELCAELIQLGDSPPSTTDERGYIVSQLIKHSSSDPHVTLLNVPETGRVKSLGNVRMPEHIDQLSCLECDESLGSEEHRQYLPCSLCRFATCCSKSYNRHLQRDHDHNTNLDCSMPLVHPVSFAWMSEEVTQMNILQDTPNATTDDVSAQAVEAESASHQEPPPNKDAVLNELNPDQTSDATIKEKDVTETEETLDNGVTQAKVTSFQPELELPSASETEAATVLSNELVQSELLLDQMCNPQLETNNEEVTLRYISSLVSAGSFVCTQCGTTALSGNNLARHLVEVCGSSAVTLNPDQALLNTKQQEQDQLELLRPDAGQIDVGMLFEPSSMETGLLPTIDGENVAVDPTTGAVLQGDLVMSGVDPNQFGLIDTGADPSLGGAQFVTQAGPGGTTTIDVTNAEGEVVQQFIIPEDLQLEEGQTLVVIHGEDGQPQLAIVNQNDLIDTSGQQMMLQTEDDQGGNFLLYTDTVEGEADLPEGMVVEQEEEKENHQFPS